VVVFLAPTAEDMVFNSLAMEFVIKLDDEFKLLYFSAEDLPKAVLSVWQSQAYLSEEWKPSCSFSGVTLAVLNIVIILANMTTCVIVPVITAFVIVAGPICK
jgi:hypothetical protein